MALGAVTYHLDLVETTSNGLTRRWRLPVSASSCETLAEALCSLVGALNEIAADEAEHAQVQRAN